MTANVAKIRPKSSQHRANPRDFAIVSGLLALYPTFPPPLPPSRPDRAADLDRQADRVRGSRPGAGVGHARQHIGGSTCVCRLFAECPIALLDIQKARLVETMRNGAV